MVCLEITNEFQRGITDILNDAYSYDDDDRNKTIWDEASRFFDNPDI